MHFIMLCTFPDYAVMNCYYIIYHVGFIYLEHINSDYFISRYIALIFNIHLATHANIYADYTADSSIAIFG